MSHAPTRETETGGAAAQSRVSRAFQQLHQRGLSPVAIYGAGRETAALIDALEDGPVRVAAVLDDDPRKWGQRLGPWPVTAPTALFDFGVRAIVICSWMHACALTRRAQRFREMGVPYFTLYSTDEVLARIATERERFAPQVPLEVGAGTGDCGKLFRSDLHAEEFALLAEVLEETRPHTYLEIGIGWAGTFRALLERRDAHGLTTTFYGLDCFDQVLDTVPNTHTSGWPSYEAIRDGLRGAFDNWQLLVGLAAELPRLVTEPVELAFHDANHTCEAVHEDLTILHTRLAPRAHVAVHNTSETEGPDCHYVARDGGPRRACAELVRAGLYEHVTEVRRLTMLRKRG